MVSEEEQVSELEGEPKFVDVFICSRAGRDTPVRSHRTGCNGDAKGLSFRKRRQTLPSLAGSRGDRTRGIKMMAQKLERCAYHFNSSLAVASSSSFMSGELV